MVTRPRRTPTPNPTSRPGRSRRSWFLLITLVALAFMAAACTSGDDTAEPAATGPADEDGSRGDVDGAGQGHPDEGDDEGAADGVEPLPPLPDEVALPLVFVHGFAGSAQQYESQAQRFVANGYPAERILAYEHDGAGMDIEAYVEGLEDVVDDALEQFDAEQVYLVGHSRGTAVSLVYLADEDRATNVAKYVAIDGGPCTEVVPCVAPTQDEFPGQAHVEVATSAESFAMQYEFLVGEPPEVTDIVAQREPVVLSGRAVEFPANTGRTDTTLDIWAVDPATGARVDDSPHATFELGEDGAWGPVEVAVGGHYEYVLSTPESPVQHHLYLQPYVRSSHLVRLLSSSPDGDTRTNTNVGESHAALVVMRMREWYASDHADSDDDRRDVLEVATRGPAGDTEPVDVLGDFVGNGTIALHLHDGAAAPGESTLEPLDYFADQPFQSGVDVYLPASAAADGTITVTNLPRGDANRPQRLNVPTWPSSEHTISVVFADHPVDRA
jgi:pimeloyl-ACP methyl ester carboxylesterase